MFNVIAERFAQSTPDIQTPPDTLTTDGMPTGVPTPTEQPLTDAQIEQSAGILAGLGAFLIFLGILGLINFVLFVFSWIHLFSNKDVPNRTVWLLVTFFLPFGALIYMVGPRRSYNKNKQASGSQNPLGQSPVSNTVPAQPSPATNSQPIQTNTPAIPVTPPTQPATPQQPQPINPTPAQQPSQPQQVQPQTFSPDVRPPQNNNNPNERIQ